MLHGVRAASGHRKWTLGILALGCMTGIDITAIMTIPQLDLGSASGLAALNVSIGTAMAPIIWGNVQEHRAKNGK